MKIFWKLCLLSVLLLGCGGLVKRNPKVEFHYYHLTGEWDVRVPEAMAAVWRSSPLMPPPP